jgi:hypothetical protein
LNREYRYNAKLSKDRTTRYHLKNPDADEACSPETKEVEQEPVNYSSPVPMNDSSPKEDHSEEDSCTVMHSPSAPCESAFTESHEDNPLTPEQEALLERVHQQQWPNFKRSIWEKAVQQHPLELIAYSIAITENERHHRDIRDPARVCMQVIKNKFKESSGLDSTMDKLQACSPGLDVRKLHEWNNDSYYHTHSASEFAVALINGETKPVADNASNFPDNIRTDDWSFNEAAMVPRAYLGRAIERTAS